MPPPATPPPFALDLGTGLSLALAFSFMPAAQLLASYVLPATISRLVNLYSFKTRSFGEKVLTRVLLLYFAFRS